MASYQITAPDGHTYQVDAPDSASQDEVLAYAKANYGKVAPPPAAAKPSVAKDVGQSFATGLKQSLASSADMVMNAGPVLNVLHNAVGLVDTLTGGHPAPRTVGPNPFAPGAASQVASAVVPDHAPQTWQGRTAMVAGQVAPAALAPQNLLSRVASVVVPTIVSSAAGETARAAGASSGVEQAARIAGMVAGGVGASARLGPATAPTADEQVANLLARRAKVDPQAAAEQAAQMRASGVDPTLTDVTGTPGQRLIKAVGIKSDAAGETLQRKANTVTANTNPAAMARTRTLPGGATTASRLAADLDTARSSEAQTTYAEPYAAPVDLKDPNVIQALRDPEGQSAINRAIAGARARMDYGAQADLEALKATANGPTGAGQVWPTTGRALDRVQIAFGKMADARAANNAGDIASGLYARQSRINGLLDSVPGLKDARSAYRAKSQAIDILGKPGARMDPFSTDPTDYADWIGGLSPEARHANQVAIRQDILDTLGAKRASSMGTLDDLTTGTYAQQNLRAALGSKEADSYLANLTARLAQKRNATQVSPNAGSPTTMLRSDTSRLDNALGAADVALKMKTGNVLGLAAKLSAYLKTRGISAQQAQALAQAATDPSRVDGVVSALRNLKGPRAAQDFVNFRGGLLGVVRGPDSALPQPR